MIFKCLFPNLTNIFNFHPFEGVSRGSDTLLQAVEKLTLSARGPSLDVKI